MADGYSFDGGADTLKQSAGFRQYDPGVYVNDDSFGKGYGFLQDSSNGLGYRTAKLSDLGIGDWQKPTLDPHPFVSKPDAPSGGILPGGVEPTPTGPTTGILPGGVEPTPTAPTTGILPGGLEPTPQAPQAVPQTPAPASPDVTSSAGFTSPIRQALLDRLQYDQQPVSLADPTVNPQFSTFSTIQQRGLEDERNATAERMAAQGLLSSGANTVEQNQNNENATLAKSAYGAKLVGDETAARRAEFNNLLGVGTGASTADLNRNATTGLGYADLGLRQQLGTGQLALGSGDLALRDKLGTGQLDLSSILGSGDLALRDKLGSGQLDLGTLQTLLGNQQQNNLLGYYYANLGNNMNRDLILNGILS